MKITDLSGLMMPHRMDRDALARLYGRPRVKAAERERRGDKPEVVMKLNVEFNAHPPEFAEAINRGNVRVEVDVGVYLPEMAGHARDFMEGLARLFEQLGNKPQSVAFAREWRDFFAAIDTNNMLEHGADYANAEEKR